jgi:hypothetical protein
MPSKIGWTIRTIEILIIVVFLLFGGVFLFGAFRLESQSLPPESSTIVFRPLYNGSSYMGAIAASLSPNSSFVVGANITAQIEIDLPEASSEVYQIRVMFLDAIVIRDIPPYAWQQDWTYLLHHVEINGTEQIQTLSNLTLVYAQEGIYALNMTITQASTNTTLDFHFDNLVQIKPLSYIEEKFRSNVTFALTYGIFGLSFIMVATAIVQLIEFFEKTLGKPQSRKSYIDTTAEDKPKGSKMSKDAKTDKKPRVQKRAKAFLEKNIRTIVFSPTYVAILCIVVLFVSSLVYTPYLAVLKYNVASDIAKLIVETDGVLIAFSGVIAGVVLGKFVEETEMAKVRIFSGYEKKRDKIIIFLAYVTMAFVTSIFFSLGALIVQNWVLTIVISIVFMFTGIIELFSMLVYLVEYDPERTTSLTQEHL